MKFWGMARSFVFVAGLQPSGVAKRFNRTCFNLTLEERAIHRRMFHNIEEVRRAVAEFVDRYNAHSRLEKLGFRYPVEADRAHALKRAT